MSETFFGRRLRITRAFHGLTLAELGERVGATRQYIHQLEAGERFPGAELTLALADALDVHPSFFSQSADQLVCADACNFRKLKTTPVRATEQVIAHGELFKELVAYVEQFVHLPRVDFPTCSAVSSEEIEAAAQHCREYWSLTADEPISNVTRVVENAGAVVTTFFGVSSKVDALSIDLPRPIIVRSVFKDCPTRHRFDIAHECGHLVLHSHRRPLSIDQKESEANRFASAFLLPRRSFVDEFPTRRSKLDWKGMFAMKRDWKVSVQAILRRAYDLGIVNAAQYRSGNIFISKKGYKVREPFEPTQTEHAELMKLAVSKLHKGYGKKMSDVSRELHVKPTFVRKLIGLPMQQAGAEDVVVDITDTLGWAAHSWQE